MNEEKLNSTEMGDDENQLTPDGKKRISWPSKDLKSMIEFVGKVYNKLGHTEHFSNKAIAAVHELSADSIKMHLSSAQQYKLLEIKHRVGYKITPHFQKLFLPKNDTEKRTAVVESLKNPETYHQLFKDYEYHTVPKEGVKNHFIRSYGMTSDIATKAATIFLDNLREYELLDTRGVLISALAIKPTIQEVNTDAEEEKNKDFETNNNNNNNNEPPQHDPPARFSERMIFQSELDRVGKKTVPIYLIDNKQAMFVYPDEITEDDIELVKHQIDGILLKIKLEAKRREKEKEEKTS